MPMKKRKKGRASIYDKVMKHAVELLRQELAPLRDVPATQQKILAQNEKITEYVRQIWDSSAQRDSEEQD